MAITDFDDIVRLGIRPYAKTEVSRTFDCPFCNCKEKRIVGFFRGNEPVPYAVFECQQCYDVFMHHLYPKEHDDAYCVFVQNVKKRLRIEMLSNDENH